MLQNVFIQTISFGCANYCAANFYNDINCLENIKHETVFEDLRDECLQASIRKSFFKGTFLKIVAAIPDFRGHIKPSVLEAPKIDIEDQHHYVTPYFISVHGKRGNLHSLLTFVELNSNEIWVLDPTLALGHKTTTYKLFDTYDVAEVSCFSDNRQRTKILAFHKSQFKHLGDF